MSVHDHGEGVYIDRDEAEFTLRDFTHFVPMTTQLYSTSDGRPFDAVTQTSWRLARPDWTLDPAVGVVQVRRATGHIRIDRGWSCIWTPRRHDVRLLGHEQGHYDVSYLVLLQLVRYVRRYARAARLLPAVPAHPTRADREALADAILADVEPVRLRAVAFQDRLNRVYDDCTDHGRNTVGQYQLTRMLSHSMRGSIHPLFRLPVP
jgi:hypothetical protein